MACMTVVWPYTPNFSMLALVTYSNLDPISQCTQKFSVDVGTGHLRSDQQPCAYHGSVPAIVGVHYRQLFAIRHLEVQAAPAGVGDLVARSAGELAVGEGGWPLGPERSQ
jgi:hypothetical protein